jgi:hypothetical protein
MAATLSLEGGCLCGAVRYRAIGPHVDAGYCHCRICQRSSGAPVLAWLTVRAESFAYLESRPSVFRSSPRGQREFCRACGTQIAFRRSAQSATVDVTIASLDDPALVQPEYHIWRGSRIPWFETADHLPRHEDAGPDEGEA